MIELKVQEFARFLVGRSDRFDLKSPSPVLERSDTREIRERILSLSSSEAQKLGTGKSTLYYLRRHARNERSFKTYKKVVDRVLKIL